MDTNIVILDNGQIRVVLLPREGGRVQSLYSHRNGIEFLMQGRHPREQWQADVHARFQDGSCAGIEECLPSVVPCGPDTEGGAVPDHGDFWQLGWNIEDSVTATHVAMHAQGFSRPLFFRRAFELRESTLTICYWLQNIGAQPVSFLYAAHPLLAVDAGDRILLPTQVKEVRLDYSRGDRFTDTGKNIPWPIHQGIDLSEVQPEAARTAEVLRSRMSEGWCGVYHTPHQEGIAVRFDTQELPSLALWICNGGWPDDGPAPYQYAVAPEPMFCSYSSLAEAQKAGAAPVLLPGEERSWAIGFEVTSEKMTQDAFRAFCGNPVANKEIACFSTKDP